MCILCYVKMASKKDQVYSILIIALTLAIPIAVICVSVSQSRYCPETKNSAMVAIGVAGITLFVIILTLIKTRGSVRETKWFPLFLNIFLLCWILARSYWMIKEDYSSSICFQTSYYYFIYVLLILFWITFPCTASLDQEHKSAKHLNDEDDEKLLLA
ncbi:uncharacterized protein LOC130632861 isoform X1 [Hydractinia symbiolongicarpus]|uniref:uncharacterized protein LOC130632861 isoform X1 n=2 Tax=Hydractinia symbiolongicarpus TaxID=13093 RepID=UPI0025510F3E|nr:uncharacterized protein LOC130632861 isoform X1 [Hydractinia symbiolongicarpus]